MRKIISLLFFIFLFVLISNISVAQNINDKNATPPQHDVLYKRKYYNNYIPQGFIEQQTPTIVIIDDKIYTTESEEFKKLAKANISEMKVVTDEKSTSGIKKIIIIQTK